MDTFDYARLWQEQFAPRFPAPSTVGQSVPTGLAIPLVVWMRAHDPLNWWTAARIERRFGWSKGTVAGIEATLRGNYPEYDQDEALA